MRALFTLLHRWVGLFIAAFLFVAAVTGTIIAWDGELDRLLNPHLFGADAQGEAIPAVELARRVEAEHPQVIVTYLPLHVPPGQAQPIFVTPKVDPATGRRYDLDWNQLVLDPVTGEEIGRRDWGRVWPITRENLISFLYTLHSSLHVPPMWGIDHWGDWLMGGIAILWTLDCFVGFYLTLPPGARSGRRQAPRPSPGVWWRRWAPAWKIKTGASAYRLNFDIHRAFGLWTWGLLFILAFTSFALNLHREIFYPVLSSFAETSPSAYDSRRPRTGGEGTLDMADILPLAEAEGQRRGWAEPVGAISYSASFGIYNPRFYGPGDDHGPGFGPNRLYIDDRTGEIAGDYLPGTGTPADIFVQLQCPLHSGRILGTAGRIIVSVMGIVIAALSVTGAVIWYRKRSARTASARRRNASLATSGRIPAE